MNNKVSKIPTIVQEKTPPAGNELGCWRGQN